MKRIVSILLAFSATFTALAVDRVAFGNAAFNDGIDRTDPNFVTASLLVMSPGDALYSSMGHSCFRLECPKFDLDYCFSYESESSNGRMLSLLSGNLKMGMFAVRTDEYLNAYADSGRSVVQYRLNLPPVTKQRLWKYLEEKAAEGISLPYDCLHRGCAQSMLVALREALKPYSMEAGAWPNKYNGTRREIVEESVMDRPWARLLLHTFSGMELDRDVAKFEKVVIPEDLVRFLQSAMIDGKPVITEPGVELNARFGGLAGSTLITPLFTLVLVLVVSCVNLFLKMSWLDILFLAFQTVFGVALSYLVFVSDLFGTDWNWLLVPFNILPLVFWKWRRGWSLCFVGVLVLWEIGMIVWPHRLTDPAYFVLVLAYVIFYLKFTFLGRSLVQRTLVASAKTKSSRSCADIFEEIRRHNARAIANRRH